GKLLTSLSLRDQLRGGQTLYGHSGIGPPPSPNNGVVAAPRSNNAVKRIRTIVFFFTVVTPFLIFFGLLRRASARLGRRISLGSGGARIRPLRPFNGTKDR